MISTIRLAVVLASVSGTAAAYQPLVTDDTGTQGAGGNQIEVSYNRVVDNAPGSRSSAHEVPLVYTRGITEELDLYVGLGRQRLTAADMVQRGWSNTALGAKWRFLELESHRLSFGLKPEIQIPISRTREAQGLGTARASYALGVLATGETGFGAVHANVAVERVNYADTALRAAERRNRYRLSVAPVWNIADRWKVAFDTGLITNADRSASATMGYGEIGAIYSPDKNLDLALGLIRSIGDGDARTTQGTLGVTWRFP